jgi:hypothetical protein
MNTVFVRRYILISLIIHLGFFLIIAYVLHSNRINKTFLVFGAHSQKKTQTFMKFNKTAVPFIDNKCKKTRYACHGLKKAGKRTDAQYVRGQMKGVGRLPALQKAKALNKKLAATNKKMIKAETSIKKERKIKENADKKLKQLNDFKEKMAIQERQARELRARCEMEKLLAMHIKEKQLLEKKQSKLIVKQSIKKIYVQKSDVLKPKKIEPTTHEQQCVIPEQAKKVDESNNEDSAIVDWSDNGHRPSDQVAGGVGDEVATYSLLAQAEKEMSKYQQSIQHAVSQLWQPPVGVPKGTTCRVMFNVGVNGKIENVEFVTRSKMLIYDLSILRVAKNFKFDNYLWNKRFTIDFCQ